MTKARTGTTEMGSVGIEPTTERLWAASSNHWATSPLVIFKDFSLPCPPQLFYLFKELLAISCQLLAPTPLSPLNANC